MKKTFRVYRAFLPGILIGLLFALLLSDNSTADIPKVFHYIDQSILVLIFSGILGGVLYTIVLDGYVELPRFKTESADAFEAGLFGDLLLGIAGAFVFDFLTISLISPSIGVDAATGDISLKVIAAKGIIGGYGGRTLMETAHKKFLKRVESLENEKDSVIRENQELAQEVVELAEEKEQLIQGADLIGQLNEHVRNGLPETELRVLTNSINAAPAPVKSQIFDISKELRSLSSRTVAMQPRTQRTIPIFETLVDSDPTNHEYHAQLAFALKDGIRPELSKALNHIDRAINLRGELQTRDDWKYELSRAVIQMQEKHEKTGSFVSPPSERDQILRDLLTVSKKRDLAEILADAKRNNIDTPIVDWLMENKVWSDRADHASSLVKQLKNVLQSRQSGITPHTDGNIERVHTGPVIESIKRVLTEKVHEAVPIDKLPDDALEALNICLTQIGLLTPQTDAVKFDSGNSEGTSSNDIQAIEDAWKLFIQQHESAENVHNIENGQHAESKNTSLVSPSSIGTLINALNDKFGEHQPRRKRSPSTTVSQFETTHTESQWVASQPTVLTSPTTVTPAGSTLTDMSQYTNFPKNFTFLGRCYDILTLDPFNTSESAKQYMVFHFSPASGETIAGESNLLKPKGSNYTPGASGGSSINSRTQILHTASDTEALFANTLGGGILSLVSKILPFSNSFSYKKFKRARTEERSIYTVTKADYIDYTLSLPEETLSELPLDKQFVRAVEQLSSTPNVEQYKKFIEKFGTHVSTEIKFGGLAYRCIRLNETLYTELSQRGTNLQLEAGKLFKLGFSNQEQGVVEREISESSETFRVNGGRPSADWASWFMSIQADPAPVKMELEPLYELLTADFFPRDRQIKRKQQLMRDSLSAYFDRNADKPQWELWQSVALGSHRGKPFSDIDVRTTQREENITKYRNARVQEIKVWSNVCVNRIQMILTAGAAFDSHGGDKGREQSLLLSEGEYIHSIEVSEGDARASRFKTYHDCITYLKIVTSEGRKLEAGKRTGPLMSLDIPKNYQVIGFHGKSGWVLDSLGIIASPLPHLFTDELTAKGSDSLDVSFSHNDGTWHSVNEEVLPIYSIAEVRSLLETAVAKELPFSKWPPQLVQVVCVALIRLGLLKQSGNSQVTLKAWKTFKQRAHLANLETIGPSSVQSLLKAIERQSKPQQLSQNSSDVPILFDKPFPEVGVQAPYKAYFNPVMGSVLVTGGFMEPTGHGYKSETRKAIYRNGTLKTIHPGHYNIGFDYGKGLGQQVTCMYSGEVTKAGLEGGYGHRIHIKLDIPFKYEGKEYTCYQAYAHCSKLFKSTGQRVAQGDSLGLEAGHGGLHSEQYGSHVDLDTYCYINGGKVHLNFELLAGNASAKNYIEPVTPMELNAYGLSVRWLQHKLNIKADGEYGPKTKQSVESFQQNNALVVDGIAGENTCRALGMTGFAIYAKNNSSLQNSPGESRGVHLSAGEEVLPKIANWVENADKDHWYIQLQNPLDHLAGGYLVKDNVAIAHGYEASGDSLDKNEKAGDIAATPNNLVESIWLRALRNCQTEGCSQASAEAEGLAQSGVSASHEIAKQDLKNITPTLLASIKKVAKKFDVPTEIIAALASRESHIGRALGRHGNKPGWGDNNQGWGILQVDRQKGTRAIRGLNSPDSQDHIEQAMEIFTASRDTVRLKHPDWSDENILKGACVAYNAGASNVRTIEKMNEGTTHNDYGDDVIARAQFYLTALDRSPA